MSTVGEIEKAILELKAEDLNELELWWREFRSKDRARKDALEMTSGYLTPEDDDFVEAVFEAGKDTALKE